MPTKSETPVPRQVSEEVVKRTACILGPASSAAKAIAHADARRAAGDTVHFYKIDNGPLIVQSAPAPEHPSEEGFAT